MFNVNYVHSSYFMNPFITDETASSFELWPNIDNVTYTMRLGHRGPNGELFYTEYEIQPHKIIVTEVLE